MKPYLILSLVIWITFSGRAQPSNAPLANFWIANNQVNAIVETKGVVYLGGNFTYVGPNTGPGGVVNATTGEPDTGWPRLSGDFATPYHWVTEAIPDGAGGWYVSGLFTRVGGLQREHVTRLLANKTVATNFNANVGSLNEVSTLALSGNTLYLGATRMVFPGAIVRNGLAAVDATTGALSSWNPKSSPDGEPWSVTSIAVMGNTVYFAGGFTNVGGQFRRNLAAVDATTGNPTAWTRDFTNSNFYALLASNNIVYVAGQIGITGPGISQVVMNLGAFDGTTGSTLWSVSVTNEGSQRFISALALSGNTLYVGGRFTSIAGVSRRSLAALNATTGTVLPWNPSANLGGGFIGVAIINGLAVSGNTVYVGGDIGFAGRDSISLH
jgi:hypothetical protein